MKTFWLTFLTPTLLLFSCEFILRKTYRTKIARARQLGITPAVGPQIYLTRALNKTPLPLSGISSRETYLCDEGNGDATYKADRFGFNNPDDQWDQQTDVVFIGDSYFQGACLPSSLSFVDKLRSQVSLLNLSSFGHGPLSQLGIILEYLPKIKAKKVFLSYVPNDLYIDLPLEFRNKHLRNYLKGEIQGLSTRQNLIDKDYIDFLKVVKNDKPRSSLMIIDKWRQITLSYLRNEPVTAGYETDYEHTYQLDQTLRAYKNILERAKNAIEAQGAKLAIIYIPDAYSYTKTMRSKHLQHLENMRGILKRVGLEFINLGDAFKDKNPYQYYSPLVGHYGHFNKQGQEIAYQYLKSFMH